MRQFKDPIYGYVNVPKSISASVIDSEAFQRLRNIRQTSYSSLYPSSLHNRFIHSIGVYHLGSLAAKSVRKSLIIEDNTPEFKEMIDRLLSVFQLACLLHDIGHAPFSHSGEGFYFMPECEKTSIFEELYKLVGNEEFTKDASFNHAKGQIAAPHELASVIVALRAFPEIISAESRDFFARCITGYTYSEALQEEKQLKNCFIQMLNSALIDVDRLDYIIRDAFSTGFQSVSIDFKRLLEGWTIIEYEGVCRLVYKKGAISVIENVIYAHDAERKWIQNHPAIMYDSFLVDHAIATTVDYYSTDGKNLFCIDALTKEGIDFGPKGRIRLMADEDILFTIKNRISPDMLIEEYFTRNKRRHPVWKSEAEYYALFEKRLAGDALDSLEKIMEEITLYLKNNELHAIDETLITYCERTIAKIEADKELPDKERKTALDGQKRILKWAKIFDSYAQEQKIPCDFVIIKASKFKSNFSKKDVNTLQIWFKALGKPVELNSVITILSAKEPRDNFFYIFYRRPLGGIDIDAAALAQYLRREVA